MRNVTEDLWNSTRRSDLSCVWVSVQDSVQDKGRERLAAIWIDRAMTAFTSEGTGTAAIRFAEHQEEALELFTGEQSGVQSCASYLRSQK
jgi:hypothetical protein